MKNRKYKTLKKIYNNPLLVNFYMSSYELQTKILIKLQDIFKKK